MMLRLSTIALAASLVCTSVVKNCNAAEQSSATEAKALIKKAQIYLKEHGVDQAVIEFNRLDSPFNVKSDINPKGDLYLFTLDSKGFQAVHGKNPKIRGKVMIEMRDIDGVYLIADMVKICFQSKDGSGWTKYRWPNPLTKEVGQKEGYVERVPGMDLCLGTGIYK